MEIQNMWFPRPPWCPHCDWHGSHAALSRRSVDHKARSNGPPRTAHPINVNRPRSLIISHRCRRPSLKEPTTSHHLRSRWNDDFSNISMRKMVSSFIIAIFIARSRSLIELILFFFSRLHNKISMIIILSCAPWLCDVVVYERIGWDVFRVDRVRRRDRMWLRVLTCSVACMLRAKNMGYLF